MQSRNRAGKKTNASKVNNAKTCVIGDQIFYEGENLAHLLELIRREIDLVKDLNTTLPEKAWLKQHFSVGVNEATRMLERMHPTSSVNVAMNAKTPVKLQAILLASDSNPKWLSKHLPSLASSRGVPLICVKDKGRGSLRLGELIKLKTAICIGIKARGSTINELIKKVIGNEINLSISTSTEEIRS